jgi:glycerol-3-phosphate dehydrogenase
VKRRVMLERLRQAGDEWDLLIVGGGATGLGCAIESASRGYRTALFEAADFARGTSSRSTKLVHGGVRYLRQGNVALVLEALKERGRLLKNAPHLVRNLPFVVPNYDWWEAPFYGIGLKLYDVLAGRHGFGRSRALSRRETLEHLPTIETEGLRGGVLYYDGQFDDARLAISMAQTAAGLGATVLNYFEVTGLVKSAGMISGVHGVDHESGEQFDLAARAVINATGPFADALRLMDDAGAARLVRPSQGVHVVLERRFLPGDSAIMVPHTDDGRVLFAIPWHDRTVVGTTDTPVDEATLEPRAQEAEIDFLLEHAARYLTEDPTRGDVKSVFAGIRPLVGDPDNPDSAAISRDHTLHISRSGLVTIAGGKWTTYRRMAQDTVDQAAVLAQLEERPCVTAELPLHGYHQDAAQFGELACYGSQALAVGDLLRLDTSYGQLLHPQLPTRRGEVRWAVEEEMARTVEDFLARRSRCLLLDAAASAEAAPIVATLMAERLGRDSTWADDQVESYRRLAAGYLPS